MMLKEASANEYTYKSREYSTFEYRILIGRTLIRSKSLFASDRFITLRSHVRCCKYEATNDDCGKTPPPSHMMAPDRDFIDVYSCSVTFKVTEEAGKGKVLLVLLPPCSRHLKVYN